MIDRKIWKGDILMLAEGNSFYLRDEVVHHRAGSAVAWQDSEVDDPLVEIDGGMYIVKRSDLHELNAKQGRIATIICQLGISEALNGIGAAERAGMRMELADLLAQSPEGRAS